MLSRRAMRSALAGAFGTSVMAGAMLLGAPRWRSLNPRPHRHPRSPCRPGASVAAGDLAQASEQASGTAMSDLSI